MKIAVTYDNGQVFGHFGHTEKFKIYTVENGTVVSSEIKLTLGNGHGALAGFLLANGVDTVICGGIGGGAQNALRDAGITLYGGVKGSCDAAVNALLAGKLLFDPNAKCDHHGHGEGHTCEGHTCSDHKCSNGNC